MTEQATVDTDLMACYGLFPWWLLLLWGILSIIIGVMLFATPGMTMVLLITFMGAYWLVGGLFTLGSLFVDKSGMGWKIFLSVINIIAGILILIYPLYATFFILSFFVIFIGFWGCFIGAVHLFQAFKTRDAGNGILGVISMIFGLILLLNPFLATELLPFVAGGFALVVGIAAVISSFGAKKVQAAPDK